MTGKILILMSVILAGCAADGSFAPSGPTIVPPSVPAGSAGFPSSARFGQLYFGPDGCEYAFSQMAGGNQWVPRLDGDQKPVCNPNFRVIS